MTEESPKDEPGADERFKRGIANALKMPPKPHKQPELKPVQRGQKKVMPRDDDPSGPPTR